eukprot:scaffold67923_cov54-Phaeocystis_antarctica.AAC.4
MQGLLSPLSAAVPRRYLRPRRAAPGRSAGGRPATPRAAARRGAARASPPTRGGWRLSAQTARM